MLWTVLVSMRIRIRIHHFKSMRIRIQGFSGQKLQNFTAKKINFSDQNLLFFLSPGLHDGHSSYRRSLQPSKSNIGTWNFFTIYVGPFCSPETGSNWINLVNISRFFGKLLRSVTTQYRYLLFLMKLPYESFLVERVGIWWILKVQQKNSSNLLWQHNGSEINKMDVSRCQSALTKT